jgi:hypothetical protein
MKHRNGIIASVALCALVAWCSCSRQATQLSGGSGSETLIGRVVTVSGAPAARVNVRLRSADYLETIPVSQSKKAMSIADAVTDDSGRFSIDYIDTGTYHVEVNDESGYAALRTFTADGADDIYDLGVSVLEKTASVKGLVRGTIGGTVRIYGLERIAPIDSISGAFSFDDLPAGMYTLNIVPETSGRPAITVSSIQLSAGESQNVTMAAAWRYSKRLYLTTTLSGAGVARSVASFPVLIRLTNSNFDFSQANSDGSDVRFYKADDSPYVYEIERWDAAAQTAEIWVKVDTVFGNSNSQYIVMYWGNSAAQSESNGAGVFDTSNGFAGVWHMGQAGGSVAYDATANQYHGTPSGMSAASGVAGAIGISQKFDGVSSSIQMQGTAASKLNFPKDGKYAVSAWVYADTVDTLIHTILAKGNQQYNFELKMRDWEFAEYKDKIGWEMSYSRGAAKTWVYLVGMRNGPRQYFYVNGTCVDTSILINIATFDRSTMYDVMIGKMEGVGEGNFPYYFKGMIDEVRILSGAYSADWIRLCYMNQKRNDALVVFK